LRKFRAAVAVALTLLFCGTAVAETFTDFPTVIKNKRNATEPELDSGYVPLTTGDAKDTRKIPAGEITRNSAVQTLTNKNINCLENNCTNFPGGTGGGGGPGGTFTPPTTCTVEGELYNNSGTLAICHISVAGGAILLNGGGHLALNGGGILLTNP